MSGPPLPTPRVPTVNALLERAARHASGVTFVDLHEGEIHLGWSDVHLRALRAAGALRALGVRPGDRVALVLRTEPAFLTAFFGALLAGAVPVPLYPPVRLSRTEEYLASTARLLRVSGARLVVAGSAVRRLLGEPVARARPELGCVAAEALEGGAPEAAPAPRARDLALVQFSSGSTVDPKPVALSHSNLMAQTEALLALLRPTPDDRLVSWLPLYHDMGLVGCLLGAASYPGPLVLLAPEHFLARPALWLRALSRHRGTISAAPNFAYDYAAARVRDEDLAGHDLSSWRAALDGAEPVAPDTLRRFAARFAPFGFREEALLPVYGLSEAALAVTFTRPGRRWRARRVDPVALAARGEVEEGGREVVSVGEPLPGVEVEVRGDRGEALPERRLGAIFVRGPSVMQGYLGQPEATARALVDGWLDTGDLGFVEAGALFVHGRVKDVVIVRGANHAPDEIERALEGLPGLRTGCAVAAGFEPAGGGEELLILAERARPRADGPGDAALEDSVRRAVLERTGVRAHTVALLAPGALPRTSSGKKRRREALRRWLAGELSPPRTPVAIQLARALVRSTLAYARAQLEAGDRAPRSSTAPASRAERRARR